MAGELTHLGFIVDGNRRWARSRGLPTLEGHRRGFDRVDEVIDVLKDTEVKYASFFIFSTENWDRSQEEIDYLMDMIWKKIDKLTKKAQKKTFALFSWDAQNVSIQNSGNASSNPRKTPKTILGLALSFVLIMVVSGRSLMLPIKPFVVL